MTSTSMSMRKVIALGLLTWCVPFAASALLVSRDGRPIVSVGVFKSTMVVIGAAVGAWSLSLVFRRRPAIARPGLRVGLLWLAINVTLDVLVLLPMTGMPLMDWAGEVGLRYLVIPVMAIAMDAATRGVVQGPGPVRS